MSDPIAVLVLGAGRMGVAISRVVSAKQGLRLVAVCDTRPQLAGMEIDRLIGAPRSGAVRVESDLEAAIRRTRPQVAIQACCSRLEHAAHDIAVLLRAGVHVISIAEEMAYPSCVSRAYARELDRLAATNGVSVLGAGVNPGFVLDLLVIALTGVCADVQSIVATRCNDLAPYGPTVLNAQGVGLSPEAFAQAVADGAISGHVGFPQSVHLIASAIGWSIDRIEERREPLVATTRRETPSVTVEPGQVAGCRHTATAYRGSDALIKLIHPQQVQPERDGQSTGDRIEITGSPNVCLAGSPEIPGGEATAAIAVNMIPKVMSAPPGLHRMSDLPVPSALMSDVRSFIRVPQEWRHA